jgi:hypothetical protein
MGNEMITVHGAKKKQIKRKARKSPPKKKYKVSWIKVWDDFEEWIQEFGHEHCPACGQLEDNYPDAYEQQEKIRELVEKHLK